MQKMSHSTPSRKVVFGVVGPANYEDANLPVARQAILTQAKRYLALGGDTTAMALTLVEFLDLVDAGNLDSDELMYNSAVAELTRIMQASPRAAVELAKMSWAAASLLDTLQSIQQVQLGSAVANPYQVAAVALTGDTLQ